MERQPLIGNGGESESKGGGRREENPAEKNDITCAARESERGERARGGCVDEARASSGKLH